MATPAVPAGSMHTAAALPRRAGRWRAALLLLALVLGCHAWLAGQLAPTAPPAGLQRPGLVQLRSLPAPAPAPAPAPVLAAELAPAQPSSVATHHRAALPGAAAVARLQQAPAAVAAQAAPADPVDPVGLPAAERLADPAERPTADADDGPAGEPPPLYRTLLPPPTQQRYALRLNGQVGEALLTWHHDAQRYHLTLDGRGAGGTPLLSQASSGAVDAHGLAPDRYVDSRRGGRAQAASFRRDIGRIGYSGPPQQHPAWPGAQDRLSWLAQLLAVLAAADGPPPEALHLFVTDARGHAGLWQLQRQPDTTGPTPWGDAPLQHWRRQPPRPEALLVDVWLARDAGTPAGAWPVRLRLQVPRSGDLVDLQWLAAP